MRQEPKPPQGSVIVYRAICEANGKLYFGITSQRLRERWAGHFSRAAHGSNKAVHGAIRKYGREAFSVEVVAVAFCREDACAIEMILIAENRSKVPNGYNLTDGGENTSTYERTQAHRDAATRNLMDPEIRRRNGERRRGRKLPEETRRKMSVAMTAKHAANPVSDETRAKISAKQIGKKLSPEQRRKISERQIGKKLTDDHKKKVGDAFRGRPLSDEHRAKLSKARMGMQFSESHKANIAAANHRRFADEEARDVIRKKLIGTRASPESKAKLSAIQKGKRMSAAARVKMSRAAQKRLLTPEGKAQLQAARAKSNDWRTQSEA